eukprot:g49314.t1
MKSRKSSLMSSDRACTLAVRRSSIYFDQAIVGAGQQESPPFFVAAEMPHFSRTCLVHQKAFLKAGTIGCIFTVSEPVDIVYIMQPLYLHEAHGRRAARREMVGAARVLCAAGTLHEPADARAGLKVLEFPSAAIVRVEMLFDGRIGRQRRTTANHNIL